MKKCCEFMLNLIYLVANFAIQKGACESGPVSPLNQCCRDRECDSVA